MMVTNSRLPFLDLINSEHIEGPGRVTDHLDDRAWAERLLVRWGRPATLRDRDIEDLKQLRSALRSVIASAMTGERADPAALARINACLAGAERTLHVRDSGSGELGLESGLTGSPAAFAALSFADVLASGEMRRVKLCANDDCRWAFFDGSRNRSKTWCSSAACGNLTKVRAFRARKRDSRV